MMPRARSALPGVDAAGDAIAELLDAMTLSRGLSERAQLVATTRPRRRPAPRHLRVGRARRLGELDEFLVERVGTRFGLFPVWGFAESPLAVVDLTVRTRSASS